MGQDRSRSRPHYEYIDEYNDGEYYEETQRPLPRLTLRRNRVQFDGAEDYFDNHPLHKEKGDAAEPAQEAEAKAEETTQVAEDNPHPIEAEVAEADQLEGHDLKTCNGHHRKSNGKLQKRL